MLLMLPGFTAEAAESRRAGYGVPARDRAAPPGTLVAQSDYGGCHCPCCRTVHCGWLGLSTCIECCDAPATLAR